jgi:hypothetical protein
MAHTIREHEPEGALHANKNENHDRGQLDAVHLNSYFKPLKPTHSHSTHARTRPTLAVVAIVAVVCAGALLTAIVARLR